MLQDANISQEHKENIVDNLSSAVQFSIGKVNELNPEAIKQDFADQVMKLAFSVFESLGKVNLAGLAILSIMTHPKDLSYEAHMDALLKVFDLGVQSEEPEIQKETSRVIGDYANSFLTTPELQGKLFALTQSVLHSNVLNPNQKLHAITAMGDICLADEANFLNNLQTTVSPFFQVAESCLVVEPEEDEDMLLLKSKLREALLDSFATVSFCISQINDAQVKDKVVVSVQDVSHVAHQIVKFYQEVLKFTVPFEGLLELADGVLNLAEVSQEFKDLVGTLFVNGLLDFLKQHRGNKHPHGVTEKLDLINERIAAIYQP